MALALYALPAASCATDPVLSVPLASPAAAVAEVFGEDDIRFTRHGRAYRVRGLSRNLSAQSLKVTLRVSAGEHLHLDTLDLYQARARHGGCQHLGAAVGQNGRLHASGCQLRQHATKLKNMALAADMRPQPHSSGANQ